MQKVLAKNYTLVVHNAVGAVEVGPLMLRAATHNHALPL